MFEALAGGRRGIALAVRAIARSVLRPADKQVITLESWRSREALHEHIRELAAKNGIHFTFNDGGQNGEEAKN